MIKFRKKIEVVKPCLILSLQRSEWADQGEQKLPQPPRLAFPFQKAQDVSLPHRTFDVSDDWPASSGASVSIHELDTYLSDIPGVTGTSQHSVDFGEFDWLILFYLER